MVFDYAVYARTLTIPISISLLILICSFSLLFTILIVRFNKKMKNKIREITKRSNGKGYERIKEKLTQFIRGWVNYFKIADMKTHIQKWDAWLRRKIRCYIWKNWKKCKTKIKNLMKLGLDKDGANRLAYSRKGYWRLSASPEISYALTNAKLAQAGYPTFAQYYKKPVTKKSRIRNRTYGGGRGAKD